MELPQDLKQAFRTELEQYEIGETNAVHYLDRADG
jgi:hypothetical protein